MHTTRVEDTTFHYNGDYSGSVIISREDERGDTEEFHVPFAHLEELVGGRLQMELINQIEGETGTETLHRILRTS